ncbi:tyrosine-type recombinase/integrase [Clostridium tertium]
MAKLLKQSKTLDFYLEDFMEHCTLKELSKKTLNSYESTLQLFFKYLKEEYMVNRIQDVTYEQVDSYLKFTKERGKYSYVSDDRTVKLNYPDMRKDFGNTISDTTINNYIRNMKVFFNYCLERRYIKVTPMENIKYLKAKRKMKDEITDIEFRALIKAINITIYSEYRDYTIIQLIFDTGMRLTETLNLKMEDIDVERRTILIPAEINKGKKDRYVFFSNTMANILKSWIQYKDRYCTSEYLFPTKKGTIITASNFERNFRLYKQRASIAKNISPHGLRNNFAKRFLLSGGDIFMLSKILGHSSVTVTEQAYLDVTMTDIRKSYQRFSPLESMRK